MLGTRKTHRTVVLVVLSLLLALTATWLGGCRDMSGNAPNGVTLGISRRPPGAVSGAGPLASVPGYRPNGPARLDKQYYLINGYTGPDSIDLRGYDLSALDLRDREQDLLRADFDTDTRWPDKLPPYFDPAVLMDIGRNPGLGLRALHARGFTGGGIGVAVIDRPLLLDHSEFAGRIRHYEELHCADVTADAHGTMAASIIAGQTTGVAPGADIYYIAVTPGEEAADGFQLDLSPLARALDRVMEINRSLPEANRIRTVYVGPGWNLRTDTYWEGQQSEIGSGRWFYAPGYLDLRQSAFAATREGILMAFSGLEDLYGLGLDGMERDPLSDPDDPAVYAGERRRTDFRLKPGRKAGAGASPLLVPMNSRTVASATGPESYTFLRDADWDSCLAYLAGLYALACQVDPGITPARFAKTAARTADIIPFWPAFQGGGSWRAFKVNPAKLMEALGAPAAPGP